MTVSKFLSVSQEGNQGQDKDEDQQGNKTYLHEKQKYKLKRSAGMLKRKLYTIRFTVIFLHDLEAWGKCGSGRDLTEYS